MTTVIPPTPQRLQRWRFVYRATARVHFAGGFLFTLSSAALLLWSSSLTGLAERAFSAGEALRQRGLSYLYLCHPAEATAFRVEEGMQSPTVKG